jgi:hypothetical protein
MRRTVLALAAVAGLLWLPGLLTAQDEGEDEQGAAAQQPPQGDDDIDWNRARELFRKRQQGEPLTDEENAYLDRAIRIRRQRQQQGAGQAPEPKASMGFTPLTEMTADDRYKEQDGGLYGAGHNEPPPEQLAAALAAAARIEPLDPNGIPSADGRIVLMSVGMSNTTQEFSAFVRLANADPRKRPEVVLLDGAQGGREARAWAEPELARQQNQPTVYEVVDKRMAQAGVTAAQVQVVWIKQARAGPANLGELPAHAQELKRNLETCLVDLKARFPTLQLAYLSSRIYGGWAATRLNPEPYAYEGAFAMRWVIQDQISGLPELNADPAKGEVKAPVVLWGPYLWADGTTPRQADGLVWNRDDLGDDGTHPSDSGRRKVAELLLEFLTTDPTAATWFATPLPPQPEVAE